jgi:hypothetical protein
VKGPNPSLLGRPWDLNPYTYVGQNPTWFWDPDGLEKTLVFVGVPATAKAPLATYKAGDIGPDGKPTGKPIGSWFMTKDNETSYLKGVEREIAQKTNSKPDEVKAELDRSQAELNQKAQRHHGERFDRIANAGHAFTDTSRLVAVPGPRHMSDPRDGISGDSFASAVKTVDPTVKNVSIFGCDTLTEGDHFAVDLKKALGPSTNVTAATGPVSITVSPQSDGSINVKLEGAMRDVSKADIDNQDMGLPIMDSDL